MIWVYIISYNKNINNVSITKIIMDNVTKTNIKF